MSTSLPELELRPMTMPSSADADDAAEFREMVRVRNLIYAEISGNDDESLTPSELLPAYAPDPSERREVWTVRWRDQVVGRVGVDIPLEPGSRIAYWLVEILRSVEGLGIGSAAYELVERTARTAGRTVLQSWAEHPTAPGQQLEPPTGFGRIPHDRIARFFLRHGYALEQVDRKSALDLTDPALPGRVERLLEDATSAASGYRIVQWQLPTPADFVPGYAWMKSRMSTDAPAAGLEFDEETWDADRLARHERVYLDANRTMLVTAAVHLDSGDPVAFNELVIGEDRSATTSQQDTLVLKEHRGHRLGMLVKCAALRTWRDIAPHSPRVLTFNAEENRPMLDINETIGFEPLAYIGAWKKELGAASAARGGR
ncbi:GNAT family N-acetyltransferase [Microbacterium sp. RD1]|uniref:GNAT family N-acetyltransferase n=1 Tax=Microbacterium sp. RD1 TaxID=3457313 RepID=UPI003FA54DDD